MSEIDYNIAVWINNNMLYIIICVLAFILLWRYGTDIRHRYFAWLMMMISKGKDEKGKEIKADLFKSMNSITSHDPTLRKNNSIKILEVGVGTGVNFEFYPNNCHLIVVDMNPHFSKYYNENRSKFPNIKSEEILVCLAEEMDMVPDNSVDAVVMTLVLCSAQDISKIVSQVYRILCPGGKFYFYEHVREWDDKNFWIRQKLQDVLSFSKLWPFLFDGCYLNRDMMPMIKKAGFSKIDADYTHTPKSCIVLKLISPHLIGVATK